MRGADQALAVVEALSCADCLDSLEQLESTNCPITKVFLYSVMSTTTKDKSSRDESCGLLDHRRKRRFFGRGIEETKIAIKSRAKKLRTSLSSLHAIKTNSIGNASSLGWNRLIGGIILLLDKKGVSDGVLDHMSELGLIPTSRTIRQVVQDVASNLQKIDVRKQPPSGKLPVYVHTYDNVDFHVFQRCVSMIGCGETLMHYEPEDSV